MKFTKSAIMRCLLTLLFAAVNLIVNAQYNVVPQTGHNNVIVPLEYSIDGKYLATAGHDFKVLVWDTKTGIHFPLYAHTTVVMGLKFSPDSKHLISTDQGGNTIAWNISTRQVVNKIITNEEEQAVTKLDFTSNDEVAMLTSRMFKVWNFRSNTYPDKIPLAATTFARNPSNSDLLLLESKSSLSSSGYSVNYKMILYDRAKKSPIDDQWIRAFGTKWIKADFSATGKYLVLAGENQIVLLDYKAKKKVWQALVGYSPSKIIITPDESKIILSGTLDQPDLMVYDLPSGKKLQQASQFTDFQFAYNHQQQIVAGAHDAGDFQYPISIYDLKAQAVIKTLYPNNFKVTKLAWKENDYHLYASAERSTFVWDLTMGAIVESEIPDFDKEVSNWKKGTLRTGSTFTSPTKNYYAESREYSGLSVFNSQTKQKVFTTDSKAFRAVFSNDGKKIYCISPDDLFVYSTSDGSLINKLHYSTGSLASIALSLDGKHLAVGKFWNEMTEIKEKYYSSDYKIDLIDPVTIKVAKQLEGHTSNVIALDFTHDHKYLISGSMDGSIRFWDPVTGTQKAILYGDSPDNYFIQVENGYYSASKSGIDKIAFDYKGLMVPGKLFETQMNRPDKVAEAFGYSSPKVITALKKAFDKRIAQLGIAEQQIKLEALPSITADNLPAQSVATKKIQIGYEAIDNASQLNHVKLLINNVPVYGRKGLPIKNKNQMKGKLDIELTEGLNTIELSVVNAKGIASLPVSFDVFCSVKTKPDLYLITIGIDKFLDEAYNLNYAAKDAKDIAALFESKKDNYGKLVHLPFTGIQATKENILAVRSTLEKSKPDDQVIIFAATHGLLDEKYDYYLATYNMMFDRPSFQGLAYIELENLMDGIPARKKLILLDACHSGEVDASEITASTAAVATIPGVKARGFKPVKKVSSIGIENSFDLMKHLFADLREGTGTTVISSAGGVEFAIESDQWSNGAFTAAFLEGIKSKQADKNRDAKITIGEMKSFVFDRVIELTNGKQHPTSRIDNIDNDFVILSTINAPQTSVSILGNWKPSEIDQYNEGKFVKINNPQNYSNVTITKGVDGFFYLSYGKGEMKLLPEENGQKGPSGFIVKGESQTTMIVYDSYMGNIRYTKAP